MTPKVLHIAEGLNLPLDFATKTAAILAQRRKGKTYTASVIAEEMVAAKQPFVALDPTGAWWGLRAGADGKSEGLPVVVLGGQHGDVPLERTGGRLIADLVVEEPGYYVIDFSLFESGEAERQFAVDFAERLYRAKGQPGRDFPLHLFVDEADRFIPQQMRKGSSETSPRLLGAFEAIVRRGGLRGLGTTLISQRAAVVNKNVLEMIDILFALRTVGPNDQDAILDYIKRHGDEGVRKEMMGSLASLDLGELWVWEPGAEPALFKRVQIRQRHTFNSSATPKPGEKRIEPKRLADVDLAALQTRMAATIEKAKADDPRELRRQIAELTKQLAVKSSSAGEKLTANVGKRVEVLTDADRALLEKVGAKVAEVQRLLTVNIGFDVNDLLAQFDARVKQFAKDLHHEQCDARAAFIATLEGKGFQKVLSKLATVQPPQPTSRQPAVTRAAPPIGRSSAATRPNETRAPRVTDGSGLASPSLPPGERDPSIGRSGLYRMLVALAQRPQGLTRGQLGVRAKVSSKGGSFDTYLSKARVNGWIDSTGERIVITDAGVNALGAYEPLPEGRALLDYYVGQFGSSGAARMLTALAESYPAALSRAELSNRSGVSAAGGSFDTYLSKLRTLELIEGKSELRASAEFFG